MVDASIRNEIRRLASRKVVWARCSFFPCLAAFFLSMPFWLLMFSWDPTPEDPDGNSTPAGIQFVIGFVLMVSYLPGLLMGLLGVITLGLAIREAPRGRKIGKILTGSFLLLPSLVPFIMYVVLIIVMVTKSR